MILPLPLKGVAVQVAVGESHHWYLGFPSNPKNEKQKRKCRNTAAKEMISARDFLPGLAPIAPPQNKLDTLLALLLLAPLKLEYSACLQDVFDSLTSFAFNNALSRHVNYHAQRLAADGGDDAYGTSTDDAEAPGHGLLRTLSSPRTGSLRVDATRTFLPRMATT